MASEKVRFFKSQSRLSEEAKILALTYNAFFVFVGASSVLFTLFTFFGGIIGFIIAVLLIIGIYIFLFIVQNKLGTKELWKRINRFYNPIDYIKVSTSMRRFLKLKREEALMEEEK